MDGFLWADVYEVWSKWSEKLSSWQRTRSRLVKKMGDLRTLTNTHTNTHARRREQWWFKLVAHTRSDMTHTSSLSRCRHLCVISATTYCNTAKLISPALSPACHHLSSVQWIIFSLRQVFPGNLSWMYSNLLMDPKLWKLALAFSGCCRRCSQRNSRRRAVQHGEGCLSNREHSEGIYILFVS